MTSGFKLEIDFKTQSGPEFLRFMDDAVNRVDSLNKSVERLGKQLGKLDVGRSSGLGSLKGVAKDIGEIIRSINKQGSLGRGNLENISRTAGTLSKFVLTASTLNDAIAAGNFSNLGQFSTIMSQMSQALQSFDKIRRPENLAVVEAAVQALVRVLKMLETSIPKTGNFLTKRFRNFGRLESLIKDVAKVLTTFDLIKRPENIQATTSGILALEKTIELLGQFNFNVIDRINRARKLGQLKNIAKSLGKSLSAFSNIRSPENLSAAIAGVRALSNLIDVLSKVSNRQQKLSRGILRGGLFTQYGTLLEGFGKFAKIVQRNLKKFTKFGPKQVASLQASAQVMQSLIAILNQLSTNTKVSGSGGIFDVEFDKNSLTGLEDLAEVVDLLSSHLKNISAINFDASKVMAFVSFFNALGNSSRGINDAVSGLGRFKSAARSVVDTVVNVFKSGASAIASVFKNLFVSNPFSRLIGYAKDTIANISRSMRRFGREMTQLGTQMLATGGIAGFIQSQQVQMVADFEATMKQIEVLGGVAGQDLADAEQLILSLGESSVFSASEVAAAFLDLSKAGLGVQDINIALEDMLNLAAAGGISVQEASNLVINAVGAMGLSYANATEIADTFVAAANIGTAEVSDLVASFGYSANTAGAFGQELEQVTAALTLMIDKGVDSSRAGTALDAFMRAMIDPSNEARETISGLTEGLIDAGLVASDATLFADSQGNFRDLNEIIELITISTNGYSEAGRALILEQIAGSANAGRAILALTEQYDDGTLALDAYLEKQAESASAAEVGAALMDTFKGSIEEMSGAFETLLIKALQPVIEHGLRPLIDGVTFIIRQISTLPQPVLAAAAAFVGLSTIMVTLTGGFLIFSGILTQLIGFGLTPLVGLLWSIQNPLRVLMALTAGQGLLMALFAGAVFIVPVVFTIVSAIRAFRDGLKSLKTINGVTLLDDLKEALSTLGSTISQFLKAGKAFIHLLWQITSPASVGSANTGLVAYIVMQVTRLVNVVNDAISPLTDLFNMLINLGTLKIPGITQVVDIISGGDGGGKGIGGKLIKGMQDEVQGFIDDTKAFEDMKQYLVLNSYNYNRDIANLRKAYESGKLGEDIDAITGFFKTTGSAKTTKAMTNTVTTVTKQFRTLDDVLRLLDEDSYAFQHLAKALDPFIDNPIIEFIFGKDVTGADLARTFTQIVFTLSQLRSVGTRTLDTFAQFFEDLRRGVSVGQSFRNLVKGIAVDAGVLAAVLLDTFTTIFGIDGFEKLIEQLGSGNLKGAVIELSRLILHAMADTFVSGVTILANAFSAVFQMIDWDAVLDTALSGAQLALTTAGTIIKWSWSQVVEFYDDIAWGDLWDSIIDSATSFFSGGEQDTAQANINKWLKGEDTSKPATINASTLFGFVNDIDWQALADDIFAGLKTVTFEAIVFTAEELFGFTVTEEDKVKIQEGVNTVLDEVRTVLDNTVDAFSGPGVTFIAETIDEITIALDSLSQLDPEPLVVIGAAILGGLAPAIGALGVSLLTSAAPIILLIGIIKGLARALPDLVDAINELASGDISAAFDSFKSAITEFWGGIKDTVMQLLDFIATLFGFDNVFTEEKYQAGIAAWSNMLDSLYYLFLEKIAIPLGQWLEGFLNFGGLTIGGETIIPDFQITIPGLNDAEQALAAHQLESTLVDVASMVDTEPAAAILALGALNVEDLSESDKNTVRETINQAVSNVTKDNPLTPDVTVALNKLQEAGAVDAASLYATGLVEVPAELTFDTMSETNVLDLMDDIGVLTPVKLEFDTSDLVLTKGDIKSITMDVDDALSEVMYALRNDRAVEPLSFSSMIIDEWAETLGTTNVQDSILAALSVAQVDPATLIGPAGSKVTAEQAIALALGISQEELTNALQTGLETVMSGVSSEGVTNMNQWLTGKEDGPIGGIDVFDIVGIQTEASAAATIMDTWSQGVVSNISEARTEIQGLQTDLAGLQAGGFVVTVVPMSVIPEDANAQSNIPVEARAGGGPVFENRLYKVAEEGISELLRIGGDTFLIPGQRGTVIPPMDMTPTAGTNMVPNTNYTPRPAGSGHMGGGGINVTISGDTAIEVSGSGLSQDELQTAVRTAVSDHDKERAQTFARHLRSTGY